jgi:Fe-S cluster assembly protein SufD
MNSVTENATGGLRSQSIELAGSATWPMWLADFRARAQDRLAASTFPGRKTEAWKYTSLNALETSGALSAAAIIRYEPLPANAIAVLDAWRVVFVNGRFDAAQSLLPDDGHVSACSLIALPEAEQPRARELLAQALDDTLPFTALNSAAFSDGLYVRVKKSAAAVKPLHVVFHTCGDAQATAQSRLLIDIEANAALTLIEQYTGNSPGMLTNAVTTIELARDARLTHVRVQLENHQQQFIGSLHLRQQAGSRCDGFLLMTGARLKRNDMTCEIAGARAELTLRGAYLVGSDEHVDNQFCIEHASPHGSSDQQFKGIVGGNGRAVFNGRIHIHPGARQTSAQLVNNNLLLSAEAEVDSKPELEIYNDDVKCSHGATVGQLNEDGVFYLQSRGIAKADAELMLSLGFVNALVDQVPVAALADWLRGEFSRWFALRAGRGAPS